MAVPRLRIAAAASTLLLAFACAESPTWTPPQGEPRSLGGELFVVLCDRVAASEMPEDVRGHRSNDICHREAAPVSETPPRLRAMAENRARLVSALDAALTAGQLDDELGTFLTELLPFYEAPQELLPEVTRAFADTLARLGDDDAALESFQRIAARRGYRPLKHALGVLEAVLKYPRLHELLVSFLDATGKDGKAHQAWSTLTRALSLELATYEPKPEGMAESTLDVTHALFFTPVHDGTVRDPRYLALRDARGLAVPRTLCAGAGCMFSDDDGDGLADMDQKLGSLRGQGAPTPFPIVGLKADKSPREPDENERALDPQSNELVYEYVDANTTFGGVLGRELLPLFQRDESNSSIVLDLADGLDVLLGPREDTELAYRSASLAHRSRNTQEGPGLDLVRLMTVLGRSPDVEPLLEVIHTLVEAHEGELASLVKGLLDAKALADGSSAQFAQKNELWDDTLDWLELMSRTSRMPGQETMLEGLMRAIADERAKHFGDIVAMMLRYTDHPYLAKDDPNGLPRGKFLHPVDRTSVDTPENRSIMERSLHLVSEINGQRGLCNKPLALGPLTLIASCDMMNYDDLGRVFGGSMSEAWKLELGLGLNEILGAVNLIRGIGGGSANTLGDIMGIQGLDEYPGPEALMRMLFTDVPLVDLMLDPLLVRNAPDNSEKYWLKKVYGNTIEGWEVPFDFNDGTRASFWNAFRPLAEAFNRHDYDPLDAEHAGDEHSYYIYMELASTFGRYYGSPQAGYASDANAPFFNVQADVRAYEGLIADIVAGPTLVATACTPEASSTDRCWVSEETLSHHPVNLGLYEKLHHVLRALDQVQVADGRDGIDIMASFVELMLNAHKACDPAGTGLVGADGLGACDRADAPYPPLEIRRSEPGDTFARTNKGVRYDGTEQAHSATWQPLIKDRAGRPIVQGGSLHAKDQAQRDSAGNVVPFTPKRYVSPLRHLLGTLNDIDGAFASNGDKLAHWRSARSGLVDQFFATDGVTFRDQTARALLLAGLDFARKRFERHRMDGDTDAWVASLEPRAEAFARTPIVLGALDLLSATRSDEKLNAELSELLAYLFDDQRKEASFDTTLYALLDLVQVLRDDANMQPTLSALSRLIAPNAPEAVAKGEPLAIESGSLERTTGLLRDILRVDEYASLSALLENLVIPHPEHQKGRETPLETLIDVAAEVNRASPSRDQGKQMTAADFKETFAQIREFLSDERRGLERLYDIVQQRSGQ
jgi:hypothetical protein